MAEPEPIELTEETLAWVAARQKVIYDRVLDVLVQGDRGDDVAVVPYAQEAVDFGGLLDVEDTDLAGYPLSNVTTGKLLDCYRDSTKPTDGRVGVSLSRQITIMESFRKQLLGRRSMRSSIISHQASMEEKRMETDDLTQMYMIGGSLE
jgi:hypothetical protein